LGSIKFIIIIIIIITQCYYLNPHARIRQKQPTLKTEGKSFLSDSLQYPNENFLEDSQVSSACSYNNSIKVG